MDKEEFSKLLGTGIIKTIFSTSQDGFSYTDELGNIVYTNPAYHKFTGFSRERIEGHNVYDLVKQGYPVSELTIAVHENKQPQSQVIRYSPNGNEIFVTVTPVFDDNTGVFIGSVANFRDLNSLNDSRSMLELIDLQYRKTLVQQEDLLDRMRKRLAAAELSMSHVGFVGHSAAARNLIDLAIRIAGVNSTVLITGESGVGKDVFARLVHYLSSGKQPYIKISCAAIPETLLESELFGYEPGAFTGASKRGKAGILEQAEGGIVFLDEIGTLPLRLQSKLLTLLQDRWYYRVGGTKQIPLKARIISATNEDLKKASAEGSFRSDLYYRLNVIPVHIPPLRERREDIQPLVDNMLEKLNATYGQKKIFSNAALSAFKRYDWPGNVRELGNIVERMYVLTASDTIGVESLPDELQGLKERIYLSSSDGETVSLKDSLAQVEKLLLTEALEKNMTLQEIADSLGISISTLERRIRRYKLPQRYRKGGKED